jgi:hypothetical protein
MNKFLIGAIIFAILVVGGSYAYKKYWEIKLKRKGSKK